MHRFSENAYKSLQRHQRFWAKFYERTVLTDNQKRLKKTETTLLNDLDVVHLTYFAAKTYLIVNSQIAFTIKLRTPRVQIIQKQKPKNNFIR